MENVLGNYKLVELKFSGAYIGGKVSSIHIGTDKLS